MNEIIKTDKFNNIFLVKTPGGKFFVKWREQGNKFTRFRNMTKQKALVAFETVQENQNFYGICLTKSN